MGGRFVFRAFSVDLTDVVFYPGDKGQEPRMVGELGAASNCAGDPVLPRVPVVDPIAFGLIDGYLMSYSATRSGFYARGKGSRAVRVSQARRVVADMAARQCGGVRPRGRAAGIENVRT
mgnify:CR=1 FL=1